MDRESYQRLSTYIRAQSKTLSNWTADLLALCYVSTIEYGPYLAAVVWYHPTPQMHEGSWMIHVAAAKEYRGRWISMRVIGECLDLPFSHGATRLYAHVTSDYVGKIWERVGFSFTHDEYEGLVAYKEQEEWDLKQP